MLPYTNKHCNLLASAEKRGVARFVAAMLSAAGDNTLCPNLPMLDTRIMMETYKDDAFMPVICAKLYICSNVRRFPGLHQALIQNMRFDQYEEALVDALLTSTSTSTLSLCDILTKVSAFNHHPLIAGVPKIFDIQANTAIKKIDPVLGIDQHLLVALTNIFKSLVRNGINIPFVEILPIFVFFKSVDAFGAQCCLDFMLAHIGGGVVGTQGWNKRFLMASMETRTTLALVSHIYSKYNQIQVYKLDAQTTAAQRAIEAEAGPIATTAYICPQCCKSRTTLVRRNDMYEKNVCFGNDRMAIHIDSIIGGTVGSALTKNNMCIARKDAYNKRHGAERMLPWKRAHLSNHMCCNIPLLDIPMVGNIISIDNMPCIMCPTCWRLAEFIPYEEGTVWKCAICRTQV